MILCALPLALAAAFAGKLLHGLSNSAASYNLA
jgi:hypothetical protein